MVSIDEALDRFKSLSDSVLDELDAFLDPFADVLPDARFRKSLRQFVPGMLAARSPHITKAAAHAPGVEGDGENLAERIYSLMDSGRYGHSDWLRCLYADARQTVAEEAPERLLVPLDPVNFEKAYAEAIEGISEVRKSNPPGSLKHQQEARLTKGYPAIIAQVVNVAQLAIPFARLFSYKTADFLSENKELMRAMRTIRAVLRDHVVCLLADAGLDDQKLYRYADICNLEFITRATKERSIEVYNARLERWEEEELQDLAATAPGQVRFESAFTHAGTSVPVRVTLDWFPIRLPDQPWERWIVVARTQKLSQEDNAAARWLDAYADPLVLITNRPIESDKDAIQIYRDWHQRPGIEHLYRFIQEDGLDIEKIQLHRLERFRREFVLILAAAVFVLRLPHVWAPAVVTWVRQLASALAGTDRDRGGAYLLLRGIQRLLSARALLERCIHDPPPTELISHPARAPT
jgi:hypothetical protein